MTDENSEEYYLAREQQERALAQAATDPGITKIHADMAARYSDLAKQAAEKSQMRSRRSLPA